MFVGKYEVRLDTKNRVSVPQKLRESPGSSGAVHSEFYLTLGDEGCIFVYTPEGWEKLMTELGATKPLADRSLRTLQRLVAASATLCTCDAQGRIVLPKELRDHAALKRDVLWVGAVSRAEIWNAERWREYHQQHVPHFSENLDIVARAGIALPGSVNNARKPEEEQ